MMCDCSVSRRCPAASSERWRVTSMLRSREMWDTSYLANLHPNLILFRESPGHYKAIDKIKVTERELWVGDSTGPPCPCTLFPVSGFIIGGAIRRGPGGECYLFAAVGCIARSQTRAWTPGDEGCSLIMWSLWLIQHQPLIIFCQKHRWVC